MSTEFERESFRLVPETCPLVDAEHDNIEFDLNEALKHLEKARDIDKKLREKLREELVYALEEKSELQDQLDDLKKENEKLLDRIGSLEDDIKSLESERKYA